MQNHTRSRIIIWLFWICLIGLSNFIFIARITPVRASPITLPTGQMSGTVSGTIREKGLNQEVPPQIVIAYNSFVCGDEEVRNIVEVWNVGLDGGEAYGQATFTAYSCINDKLSGPKTLYGTFSGGPNGSLFFPDWTYPGYPEIHCHFDNGTLIKCLLTEDLPFFYVENPEAFGVTPTEAVSDCYPVITNIDNLKPGDVLSPAIDFIDEKGQPVDIIGHALFINGVETHSVMWDGNETRLEVQYTCLNHRGDSKTIIIPAYQDSTPGSTGGEGSAPVAPPQSAPPIGESEAPIQPGDGSSIQPGHEGAEPPVSPSTSHLPVIPGGIPTAIGIAGLAMGLGGAAVSGGAVVVSVLNTALAKPPAPPPPPVSKQTAPPNKKGAQKEKEAKTEKEKKEKKEKKPERKGLLQSEKEALEKYKETLETLSNSADKGIDLLDGIQGISEESKKRLTKQLKEFKGTLDDMVEKVGDYNDKIEMVQDVGNKLRSLGQKYKQIQKAHQEAFKDLADVPEGAANQLADLTTAIETFGDVADAALSRIPYFKQIYSDENFEVTKSFKEFSTGLRKTLSKTIFRTAIEAKKEFTAEELKAFGDNKVNRRLDPEIQEFLRQQKLNQPQSEPNSILQQVKDFLFGKDISPKTKSFR
ncbi:MAG: hypothetical protein JW908_03015 [Anaerolineales bacterium]|nr:hypothetical protein [Anaerolineales bacterium]